MFYNKVDRVGRRERERDRQIVRGSVVRKGGVVEKERDRKQSEGCDSVWLTTNFYGSWLKKLSSLLFE